MTATQLLDGEWRFFPLISEGNGPTEVASAPSNDLAPPPDDAYASEPILVPGTWNDFPDEVGGDWGHTMFMVIPSNGGKLPPGGTSADFASISP
jgi:hypothetical protein